MVGEKYKLSHEDMAEIENLTPKELETQRGDCIKAKMLDIKLLENYKSVRVAIHSLAEMYKKETNDILREEIKKSAVEIINKVCDNCKKYKFINKSFKDLRELYFGIDGILKQESEPQKERIKKIIKKLVEGIFKKIKKCKNIKDRIGLAEAFLEGFYSVRDVLGIKDELILEIRDNFKILAKDIKNDLPNDIDIQAKYIKYGMYDNFQQEQDIRVNATLKEISKRILDS